MKIRPEEAEDQEAIRQVNEQAFGRAAEASLVEALRTGQKIVLSLVAVEEEHEAERVAGHILFCPVAIEGEGGSHQAVGLGPMAVRPEFQRRGIGSALVRAGLEALRQEGHRAVVVLGHPEFYSRFGFAPASTYGVACPFDVPDEAFMLAEMWPGAWAERPGTVLYPPEFNDV